MERREFARRRSLGVERAAASLRSPRHLVALVGRRPGGGPRRGRVLGHGVVGGAAGDARRAALVDAGGRGGGRTSGRRRVGAAAVTGGELRGTVGVAAGRRTIADVRQTSRKHLRTATICYASTAGRVAV